MALSDCEHCWDTPCTCGFHWKDHSTDEMIKIITSMLNHKTKAEARKILVFALVKTRQKPDEQD